MSKTKTVTCPYCRTEQEVDMDEALKKSIGTVMRNVSYSSAPPPKPKYVTLTCTNPKCLKEFKVSV